MQLTINGEQAAEIADLFEQHADGEPVTFEKPGLGETLIVAFSLATFEISGGGTVEEI